jgi:hypothetical protein
MQAGHLQMHKSTAEEQTLGIAVTRVQLAKNVSSAREKGLF